MHIENWKCDDVVAYLPRAEKRLRSIWQLTLYTVERNLVMSKVICHTPSRLSSEQKYFICSYFDEHSIKRFLSGNAFNELSRFFRTRFRRAIHFKVANRLLQKRNNDRNGRLKGAKSAKKKHYQLRLARHTIHAWTATNQLSLNF